MISASNHAQTSAGPGYGSHPIVGERRVRQALGRVARDGSQSQSVGIVDNPKGHAAVATPLLLIAVGGRGNSIRTAEGRCTGSTRRRIVESSSLARSVAIQIALPTHAGIEWCGRLTHGCRRVASHTSRLAKINVASFTSRDGSKPRRINALPEKPIVEPSHLVEHLSCAPVAMTNRDTRQGQKIGYRSQFGAS